jgi:hypothetical protein
VVGFDSTILPGREGTVTEEVEMSKLHEGSFVKYATVTSNAKNKPELKLSLKGVIKVAVSVSPQFVQMIKKAGSSGFETELTLTTEKPDLQVKDVTFSSNTQPATAGQNAWSNKLPVYLTFKLAKPEKPKADGSWEYKLALKLDADLPQTQNGEFAITTNHPEAQELKESGNIDVGPAPKK